MKWIEVTVKIAEEAAEAVSHYLNEQGAGGVAIEQSWHVHKNRQTPLGEWYEVPFNDIPEGQVVIKAYFPEEAHVLAEEADLRLEEAEVRKGKTDAIVNDGDAPSIALRLRRFISRLPEFGIEPGSTEINIASVAEEDWSEAWKQYYKPLRVGERLTVKPVWEPYQPAADEIVIELDPGMAFGTGTHATTALCMRMLEQFIRPGDDVIDVGTGSGILAAAAARLGARRVLAVDLDPVAVSSARDNARLNGVQDRVFVMESDLLGVLKQEPGEHDAFRVPVELPVAVVVANILAEILLRFVDDVARSLRTGGIYIASGIIESKASDVVEALRAHNFDIVKRMEEEGWVALAARKK